MYIKKNYQVTAEIPDASSGSNTQLWQLQHYLSWIQTDINNLHRELTYWDLYKINYVIDDANRANGIINNLAPGQAAVIGFDRTTEIYGKKRSRGDIVIKLINDQLFWIDSKSSGIYKPTGYSNNSLNYTYSNEEPTGDDVNISIEVSPSEGRTIYGDIINLTDEDTNKPFDAAFTIINPGTEDEEIRYIRPVIRFYTANNEIIDIDFNLSLNTTNNTYTVDWHTANSLLKDGWLQVK